MMEQASNIYIALAVSTPLVAAVLILLSPRKLAEAWSMLAAIITLIGTVTLFADFRAGNVPMLHVMDLVPGLGISFRIDALGITFGMLASVLWVLATMYSYGYVRDNKLAHCRRYFACFAASIGAALGIAYSSNLITFLLFYEALTLATYPLVVHKETREAMLAGRRYLFFALSGGLLLTVGVIWTWAVLGTVEFTPGGFMHQLDPGLISILFVLLFGGVAVKAAIMPLHAWLPAAMVAPSPVSALLHAVAVVKAGVFGCMRVFGFTFGPESLDGSILPGIVIIMTATTIVIGSL
ncbi:MAG: proton-conducting transporter membrane subunit, partial [Phycisphaeraceae bacterium]